MTTMLWLGPTQGNQGTFNGATYYSMIPNVELDPIGNVAGEASRWVLTSAFNSLPSGTSLDWGTGSVQGILNNVTSSYAYTISRTTSAGTISASFSGNVVAQTGIASSLYFTNPFVINTSTTGSSFTFTPAVAGTGLSGTTTYSFIPTPTMDGYVYGQLPAGTTFNSSTGVVSGTLAYTQELYNSYSFTLLATNNGRQYYKTFTGAYVNNGAPSYYRIKQKAANVSGALQINEIVMATVAGGTTVTTGGTAIASTASSTASSAFDGNTATAWKSSTVDGSVGQWIGYQFSSPVTIAEIRIFSSDSTAALTNFDIQRSWDGINWGNISLNTYSNASIGNWATYTGLSSLNPSFVFNNNANQGNFVGNSSYNFNTDITVYSPSASSTSRISLSNTSVNILPRGTISNMLIGRVMNGIYDSSNISGNVSGTLYDVNQSYFYTVKIESNGYSAEQQFYGNVLATSNATTVTWNSPAAGTQPALYGGDGLGYLFDVSVTNPVGSTTFSLLSGTLPPGTSLYSNQLSGFLTNSAGTYTFTIRATNNGIIADRTFTQQVLLSVSTWNSPTPGAQGQFTGGTSYSMIPNYTLIPSDQILLWRLNVDNSTPLGTTLNSTTGAVTGTIANVSSTYSYTIYATTTNYGFGREPLGGPLTATFTGTTTPSSPSSTTVTWNSPAAGAQANVYGGSSYSFTPNITVTNAVGSTTYSILTGTIPTGTTFNTTTGVISGTLTNVANNFAFTIRATNNGINADRSFTQNVLLSSNTWNSPTQGNQGIFTGGTIYSMVPNYTIVPSGQSIIWNIASGTLPAGTTLNSTTGAVTGTLTNANSTYSYTLVASTIIGPFLAAFSGTIVTAGTTVVTWNSPAAGAQPDVYVNSSYTFTSNVTITNPVGSTTYSILTGTIPAGTTLNTTTGVISGTLTNTVASYAFTVRATNNGINADRAFTQNVLAASTATTVTWNTPAAGALGTERGGTNYYFVPTVTVTNPTGLTVYSIIAGSIPSGTIFDPKTGIISGTLSNVTSGYGFTIRASVNGINADRAFTGNVFAA